MAFDSRVFRVLIASPSDAEEEREIAVKVIRSGMIYTHFRVMLFSYKKSRSGEDANLPAPYGVQNDVRKNPPHTLTGFYCASLRHSILS